MRRLLVLWFACLFAVPASAGLPRPFPEISTLANFVPKPGMGYILVRVPQISGVRSFEPVLLRINTDADVAAVRAAVLTNFNESLQYHNVQSIDDSKALYKTKSESVYLVEARPGRYVVYGVSWASGIAGVHTCFCLGTVGFDVEPNVVTDIGYFYGDKVHSVSKIPELSAESGFGPSSDILGGYLLGGTMRPATPQSTLPSGLGLPVKAAQFYAVGKYYSAIAGGINRMVPIPGILDYDRGRVIDVQTGKVAPDHF